MARARRQSSPKTRLLSACVIDGSRGASCPARRSAGKRSSVACKSQDAASAEPCISENQDHRSSPSLGWPKLDRREPEKGSFFRADNFEFAKVGVPALYIGSKPKDYVGQPADYGQKKSDDYTLHHYHQVSDEVNPAWDLSGAVEDIRLLFEIGYQVAQADQFPTWLPGSEFKARRDKMMAQKK